MEIITPTPGPGIARGVPKLLGFRLTFADLADPADPPFDLVELAGGTIILGGFMDIIEGFDDGAGSAIEIGLTFDAAGDAIVGPTDAITPGAEAGGARALVPFDDGLGRARVLDAPATLAAFTTSAETDPYTAGIVDVWVLVAEINR